MIDITFSPRACTLVFMFSPVCFHFGQGIYVSTFVLCDWYVIECNLRSLSSVTLQLSLCKYRLYRSSPGLPSQLNTSMNPSQTTFCLCPCLLSSAVCAGLQSCFQSLQWFTALRYGVFTYTNCYTQANFLLWMSNAKSFSHFKQVCRVITAIQNRLVI